MKSIHYSHHYRHKDVRGHKISYFHRLSTQAFIPLLLIFLSIFVSARFFNPAAIININELSLLFEALTISFLRLLLAYVLSLLVGISLAILATSSKKVERILLPIFDTLESIPILVFFPVIIVLFISYRFFNFAAIFIISLNMIWNIVFAAIAGIKLIPLDILAVGTVFSLNKLQKFTKILLPSLFPHIVTGSLLAWAEGWNILMVAEVLKTYVPKTISTPDLFGIGSVLVNASVAGNSKIFFGSVFVIIFAVIVINVFIWQPLLRRSEKYRFDF